MKWFLEETYPPSKESIEYGDGVVFLGSCFSQNIHDKGKKLGFNFTTTNHGTIFHPIPLARIISEAIKKKDVHRILEQDGRFFSWDASHKLFAQTEKGLISSLEEEKSVLKRELKAAKFLFITFGTAKAYSKDKLVVANCHKIPVNQFEIELSDLNQLIDIYTSLINDLLNFNPNLNIVFTVSPVRHSKDGLIVNNRSKSRLLMLCEELEKMDNVSYFPAYEIVLDQLRDYRFFTSDLVHPTEDAVKYVWQIFEKVYFTEKTIILKSTFEKFKSFFGHFPIHRENQRELLIRKQKEIDFKEFLLSNPEILS